MINDVVIREGTISEVVEISNHITEFDNPHNESVYETRLHGKDYTILIASFDNELIGFKIGYNKFDDGSFYTWMGGVKKKYRRHGIAKKLAEQQEKYAKKMGYHSIILKTRNRHKNMLIFAIQSGFNITDVLENDKITESRILLKKKI